MGGQTVRKSSAFAIKQIQRNVEASSKVGRGAHPASLAFITAGDTTLSRSTHGRLPIMISKQPAVTCLLASG